jgi:hypothetical protein
VYWLIIAWLPIVIGAGVCVNGSAAVFCGCDMWFVGGRNVCAIFFVYLRFWCVNPFEQVLAGHPRTFTTVRLRLVSEGRARRGMGF